MRSGTGAIQWLLWQRFTVRHWVHAPGASLALTLILALGVAVFFSIRLANRSAVAGFSQFSVTLTGDADLLLSSPSGRLPVSVLGTIRHRLGTRPAVLVPVLEATASLPGSGDMDDDFDARQLQVVGLDLIGIQNLRYVRDGAARPAATLSAGTGEFRVGSARTVYVTRAVADRLGLAVDDPLEVILGDRPHRLRVGAVVAEDPSQIRVPGEVVVMDLPALQSLVGRTGSIDRVEVFLPASAENADAAAELERVLAPEPGDPWEVQSAGARKAAAREMTAAFRANLTILSLLALLVGVYLILQALEAAVVRRREEIATLLSIGLDEPTIARAWVIESATFGFVGTLFGLGLGYAGAQLAVSGVARTVNALYLSTDAARAGWHWGEASLAFVIGIGASLLAGILPARDAARTPPAQILRQGSHSPGIRLLDHPWLGVGLIAGGTLLTRLPPVEWAGRVRFPLAGYLGAICWLVGASILAAAVFPALARILRPLARRSAVWNVAASQFRRPSGRHKLTAAGLVVAVGMAAGMGILIHSFEETMQVWIHNTLKADLFVAPKGVQNASNRNRIAEATWQDLRDDPDVVAVDVGHIHPVRLDGAPTFLAGIRLGRDWSGERMIWVDRRPGLPGLDRPDDDGRWPAYVSESFSRRFARGVGDPLEVPTPAGEQALRVAGVFADYGNERGSILVNPERVTEWFGDRSAVNLAAYLAPGADSDRVRRRWTRDYPGLAVRTNAALRAEILRIFRQTFSITYALKSIGVTVAVAGLVLALVSLLIERRRDLGTLRELGMSTRQVCSAVTIEGAGIAAIGLAGGLALSVALGYVLIFVINRQSFGWTLGFAIPWGGNLLLAIAVLAAALASSFFVGRWAAQLRGEQEE